MDKLFTPEEYFAAWKMFLQGLARGLSEEPGISAQVIETNQDPIHNLGPRTSEPNHTRHFQIEVLHQSDPNAKGISYLLDPECVVCAYQVIPAEISSQDPRVMRIIRETRRFESGDTNGDLIRLAAGPRFFICTYEVYENHVCEFEARAPGLSKLTVENVVSYVSAISALATNSEGKTS